MNIKSLFERYKELVLYGVVGVMTTVINLGIFYIASLFLGKELIAINIANMLAWVGGVSFAFIANKLVVFKSKSFEKGKLIKEILSFVAARVASLGVEVLVLNVGIGLLGINEMVCKVVAQVGIILMNYVLSKYIIFKK